MKVLKLFFILLVISTATAKDVSVIEIRDFRHRDFAEKGFTLSKNVRVRIEARGASDRWGDNMLAYPWILDSATRHVVWQMTPDNSKQRLKYDRKAVKEMRLSSGKYELYYAVSPRGFWGYNYRDFGDFLQGLFSGFRRDWRRKSRSWGVILSVDEKDRDAVKLTKIPQEENAVVQIAPLGDDEFEKKGFSLSQEAKLRVYAIGEGDNSEMYDYGWIVNNATGKPVWEMKYRRTRWAGGADKNRMVDEEITLPPGDYIVYFVTDGSHSSDGWNSLPPFDPSHWGITLWAVGKEFQKKSVVKPYKPEQEGKIIVDITRVGNNRFEEKGFVLKKPTRVRIRCLGEYGYRGHFVDYGWILDASTRKPVWQMSRENTQHAGGAKKNRLFDGIISLAPGYYEVYYITDDSYAYRSWNAGPPYDPEAWGITLWGVGKDFDPANVKPYYEERDSTILVQMIRMGDHERAHRRFILKEPTEVRIYAIGEGEDGEMYDCGWIENAKGYKIWKMEYRDTEYAGGAHKNCMVNEVIRLDPGEYTVYYRTDGSHSFEDWNDDPPTDPVHWGIAVKKEN